MNDSSMSYQIQLFTNKSKFVKKQYFHVKK